MNFGIFYEHQLPRAAGADWDDDAERRLYQEALEQVELADRVGTITSGRSSTTFSRSIRIPRRPRCSSRPARSAPNASDSATALR